MAVTFSGPLLEADRGGMAVEVPSEVMAQLGSEKRPAVRVVINGSIELRTRIAVYGGKSYIGVRKDIRELAEVLAGELLELTVEIDDAPRSVEFPDDLATALGADPEALRLFEALSFTNRTEYVRWVTEAKRLETRQHRVAETPRLLKQGRRTPR